MNNRKIWILEEISVRRGEIRDCTTTHVHSLDESKKRSRQYTARLYRPHTGAVVLG